MTQKGPDDELLQSLLAAVTRALDVGVLRAELGRLLVPAATPSAAAAEAPVSVTKVTEDALHKLVLADVLDDAILGARPGEKSFPLRLLFGALGGALADESAFALASGLNFYFRAAMDEEVKMRLGVEVSRGYYRFASTHLTEPGATAQTSPLLAALMNSELERVRFESVDHVGIYDSSLHEREPAANAQSATLLRPTTFLCRVAKSSAVRIRAMVMT